MFEIDTAALKAKSYALSEGSSELNRCAGEIISVKILLEGLSSMGPILGTLDSLSIRTRRHASQEEMLYTVAQRIVRTYEDAEDAIISNMEQDKFDINIPAYSIPSFMPDQVTAGRKIDSKVLKELLELFK